MARIPLGLDSLQATKVDEAFRDALLDCGDDIRRRPNLDVKREVHLVLEITPDNPDGTGEVDTAQIKFKVWSRIPKHELQEIHAGVNKDGSIVFNPASPDDIRQGSLDEPLTS